MVDSREERTECGVFERVMERALGQYFGLKPCIHASLCSEPKYAVLKIDGMTYKSM